VVVVTKPESFEEYDARWHAEQAAEDRAKLRFNPAVTDQLVAAVRKQPLKGHDVLADDLELALRRYEMWKDVNDQPAFGKMYKWFDDSAKGLKRMYGSLSHSPDENRQCLDKIIFRATNGRRNLTEFQSFVDQIQMWETTFGGILKSNWFGADRIGGPSAKHWLIGETLPEIYKNHFGEELGFSRDKLTGMLIGPGVRFLVESLSIMSVLNEDGDPFAPSGVEYYLKKRGDKLPT
jgi:hypothetical protein